MLISIEEKNTRGVQIHKKPQQINKFMDSKRATLINTNNAIKYKIQQQISKTEKQRIRSKENPTITTIAPCDDGEIRSIARTHTSKTKSFSMLWN